MILVPSPILLSIFKQPTQAFHTFTHARNAQMLIIINRLGYVEPGTLVGDLESVNPLHIG